MGRKSIQKREKRIKEGRQATLRVDIAWTPMESAVGPDGSHTMTDGEFVFTIWKNSRYTVMKRDVHVLDGYPPLVHLSIRRNDRKPIMNWRDMQKIKNELVGPECEGVQIFPAESRLVDNANQYHLFVCAESGARLPFGYDERLVSEGNHGGSVQEPFEEHVRPDDLVDSEDLKAAFEAYRAQFQPVTESNIFDSGL